MKISILMYKTGIDGEKTVHDALVSAGLTVCAIDTLSGLHTILSSRMFDAVLVSRKTLAAHCLDPEKHLSSSLSSYILIDWSIDSDNGFSYGVHEGKERNDGGVRTEITNVLERIHFRPAGVSGHTEPVSGIFSGAAFPLHRIAWLNKKTGLIFQELAASGSFGIDIPSIQAKIWGIQGKSRKKDIEIYISKIRKFLSVEEDGSWTVVYNAGRYFLVKTSKKHPAP